MRRNAPRAFFFAIFLALLGPVGPTGCATAPPESNRAAYAAYREIDDPLEPFNRGVFAFNRFLDHYILMPTAWLYIRATPAAARKGVSNFVRNVGELVVLTNDLLQGRWALAGNTVRRLTINTFLGIFGLVDLADQMGYTCHPNDFGLTLRVYGMGGDFYLMLPLLGPSSGRDALGQVADVLFSPFFYTQLAEGPTAVAGSALGYRLAKGIVFRSDNYDSILQIESSSFDLYVTLRDLYRQNRESNFHRLSVAGTCEGGAIQ